MLYRGALPLRQNEVYRVAIAARVTPGVAAVRGVSPLPLEREESALLRGGLREYDAFPESCSMQLYGIVMRVTRCLQRRASGVACHGIAELAVAAPVSRHQTNIFEKLAFIFTPNFC